MPVLPDMSQQDYAQFDFIQGLKLYNYRRHVTAVLEHYRAEADAFRAEHGREQSMAEAGLLIEPDPTYELACEIQRASQLMMWQAGIASLEPRRDEVLRLMEERTPAMPIGRLELNPLLQLPDWYIQNDIHLTPGGYWGYDLIAPMYERTVCLYRTSWRRDPDPGALRAFAASAPPRRYDCILDLGCAFGASTRALRRAYPGADEIVG